MSESAAAVMEAPAAAVEDQAARPVNTGPSEGYANRLMSAKKRAAEQIREQADEPPK